MLIMLGWMPQRKGFSRAALLRAADRHACEAQSPWGWLLGLLPSCAVAGAPGSAVQAEAMRHSCQQPQLSLPPEQSFLLCC